MMLEWRCRYALSLAFCAQDAAPARRVSGGQGYIQHHSTTERLFLAAEPAEFVKLVL